LVDRVTSRLANSAGQEARLKLLPYSGQAGNYAPGSRATMDAAGGRSVDVAAT
jgi:hypothetical protein